MKEKRETKKTPVKRKYTDSFRKDWCIFFIIFILAFFQFTLTLLGCSYIIG